jgi:hypothetical protein
VQNDPNQPTKPMGHRFDGWSESQTRLQTAIRDRVKASLVLDRGVGRLIENAPQVTVDTLGER